MGLFDDAEKLIGAGNEDKAITSLTQEGEKLLENQTGGKFDSEIQSGGDMLDKQVEQELPKL